jgi:hypothetical protein
MLVAYVVVTYYIAFRQNSSSPFPYALYDTDHRRHLNRNDEAILLSSLQNARLNESSARPTA